VHGRWHWKTQKACKRTINSNIINDKHVFNKRHRAGWCRGISLDAYSSGRRFESPSGHRLSWLRFIIVLLSPGESKGIMLIRPRPRPSNYFPIHHSSVRVPFDAIGIVWILAVSSHKPPHIKINISVRLSFCYELLNWFSSSYMALQPISGLGFLFMRFRNLTLMDGWQDFLDDWSAHRKAATYTGQHKHRINANKHPCL
jgi:hypothetical protein